MGDTALDIATLGGRKAPSGKDEDALLEILSASKEGMKIALMFGGPAAGVLEALFERWSIGDMKAMKELSVTGIKSFARNVAKSARVNASEEVLTEAANIAFDTLFMGDVSNWQLSIKQYMAQGMSEAEAKQRAYLDQIGRVFWAGAGGALSGGIMGGTKAGLDYRSGSQLPKAREGANQAEISLVDFLKQRYNGRTEVPLEDGSQNGQGGTETGSAFSPEISNGDMKGASIGGNLNTISTLDDLLLGPTRLAGVSGDVLYGYLVENGYDVQPLSRGSYKGVTFEEGGGFKVNWGGDRMLQYHPTKASHHGSAYIKLSSGETGTIRIDLDGNIIE